MKSNKKPLIAIALIALIGIVGGTFAIFTNTESFQNVFKTGKYSNTITETFTSPENWIPGTTTPKTVEVENTGTIPVVVRVSYTQEWKSTNEGSLPLQKGGKDVAIINFANQDKWTKQGEYYYYNEILAAGAKTNSFIESVKFNDAVEFDEGDEVTCATTEAAGKKTITCSSSGNGYSGATYTLNIKVEIVQADGYASVWTDAPEIA